MTTRPETAECKKPEPWAVSNLVARTVSDSLSGAAFAWFLDAKVSKGAWIGAVGGASVWAATNLYDHLTKEDSKKPVSTLPKLSIDSTPEKRPHVMRQTGSDPVSEIFGKFLVTEQKSVSDQKPVPERKSAVDLNPAVIKPEERVRKPWER